MESKLSRCAFWRLEILNRYNFCRTDRPRIVRSSRSLVASKLRESHFRVGGDQRTSTSLDLFLVSLIESTERGEAYKCEH